MNDLGFMYIYTESVLEFNTVWYRYNAAYFLTIIHSGVTRHVRSALRVAHLVGLRASDAYGTIMLNL